MLAPPCARTVREQSQKRNMQDEEAKVDRLGPARDRDRPQIGKDSIHDREGAVTPRHDDHAGDQGPRGRVRQGRGLPRHEQVRVQDGVREAAGLRPPPPRREKAVQVLPPVQLALPRVRRAEVREAAPPVRLQSHLPVPKKHGAPGLGELCLQTGQDGHVHARNRPATAFFGTTKCTFGTTKCDHATHVRQPV